MADLAELAGRAVAVPVGAVARWRHGRAVHPRGAVFDAVLERYGATPPVEVPWLDAEHSEPVVVRLSRGAGLPAPLPDVLGLAIRLGAEEAPVDLLLSSAGRGPWSRRVPIPRIGEAVSYGSIMAYSTTAGPVRITARAETSGLSSDPAPVAAAADAGALVFTLAAAVAGEGWRPFARLRSTGSRGPLDPAVRFDAVRNPPPGLVPDGPLARFRAPAYAAARVAGPEGR
ncbi:phosphodiesterase [Blastococcus saxobsidens]|uniref:phosphodiesterase n=1 Tax=Blastococcus saxobsidens TaxID=138336 RepID=UPI0031F2EB64